MIEIGKKYVTREGCDVRILATDLGGSKPVAAAITTARGSVLVQQYHADGSLYLSMEDEDDLIEVSEYSVGQPVECRTSIGWRQWFVYHSQLETGVHLVVMGDQRDDVDAKSKYRIFASSDVRPIPA